MSDATLHDDGDGLFRLAGEVTFSTVRGLLDSGQKAFEPHSRIIIDLSEITRSDSAGLALLIEWVTWANHSVREIRYQHVPEKLMNIASISEVEALLDAGERWTGFL
ncbi:MAG: STAS domain-containing protein [Pseudomonadota bacterium]